FNSVWPKVGEMIVGDRESYQYLVESIRVHPDQTELREMMMRAGYEDCRYYNLLDGIVAIHTGSKP
ncbi:MAG: class I SAM-dependent methyltransferase, partial [Pseudomonadales bacterium]|nr:class I SAM-dependent methyltransferase [Pseudomonadales bacterium]